MKRLVLAIAAASLLGAAGFAQACSTSAWSGVFGSPTVGGPEPTEPDVKRFIGRCAMEVDADEGTFDTSPSDEASMVMSFAGRAEGMGNANVLVAFSDNAMTPGNEILTVNISDTTVTVQPNDGGSPASAPISAGFWHVFQIKWAAGDTIELYVDRDPLNGDSPNDTGASGLNTSRISSVAFGARGGTGGLDRIGLDQYVSLRTNFAAADCIGDANGDGQVNVGDASLAVAERLGNNVADGAPDCNRDGTINVGDASCMVAIRLGPTGGVCP